MKMKVTEQSLVRTKRCLLLFMSIAIALALLGSASWAQEDQDRVLLHRNGLRGVAYNPVAVAGAPSSVAPLRGILMRKFALDGDGQTNVRGNIYPIDVDGDGNWELLHFNGYRVMRVYRSDGVKLWQISNPDGRVHRTFVHRDTIAVLDVNGDGRQDIIHCWASGATGPKYLVARDGLTGRVLRQAILPDHAGNECQIAAFKVYGAPGPLIFVSAPAPVTAGCEGNFVDRWSTTLVFDTNLVRKWQKTTCNAGHYVWPVGIAPGNTNWAVAVGKYIFGWQGNLYCTLSGFEHDHVDSMAIADLNPTSPNYEIVAVGQSGLRAYRFWEPSQYCRQLWSISGKVIPSPQYAIMAELDAATPGLNVAVRSRDSGHAKEGTYILNATGQIVGYSSSGNYFPMENTNLDGALGTDELAGAEGWVMDGRGRIRLDDAWYRGLEVLTPAERSLSRYDKWTFRPVWFDLDRDGRDEIVTWGRHTIVIGRVGL